MTEFYKQFFCKTNQSYSLIIEDDGRVAYAYLLLNEEIIGDLWLYNQEETPSFSDWSNPDNMPFLNSQQFVRNIETDFKRRQCGFGLERDRRRRV